MTFSVQGAWARSPRGWTVAAAIGSPACAAALPSPTDIPVHWLPVAVCP